MHLRISFQKWFYTSALGEVLKVAVFSLSLVEDKSSSSEDVEEIEEEVSTSSLQDSGM